MLWSEMCTPIVHMLKPEPMLLVFGARAVRKVKLSEVIKTEP